MLLRKSRLIILFFLFFTSISPGATYMHSAPDFILNVPKKYIEVLTTDPSTLYTFATSDPAKGFPDATISIQRLHGTIGPEHMDLKATGIPDAHFITPQPWKAQTLDVVAGHMTKNNISMAFAGTQIPLPAEAIQILVVVPLAKESTAPEIIHEFLAGLEGTSTWGAPPAASSEPAESSPWMSFFQRYGAYAIGGVVVLFVIIVGFARRKP